jgi:hypothetical protein
LTAIVYYGWQEGKRTEQERDGVSENKEQQGLIEPDIEPTPVPAEQEGEEEETLEEFLDQQETAQAVSGEIRAGKDTVYRLECYDIYTKKLTVSEQALPAAWIGMTREEVEAYWDEYCKDMPLEEFEQGLLSCECTSFSKEQIVVRKSYDGSGLKYQYYMILKQGNLIVYYSDKKTVYENTEIFESDLPQDEVEKLKNGIYIEDEETLYSVLESYTS